MTQETASAAPGPAADAQLAEPPGPGSDPAAEFEAFFRATEPKLRRALVAAYGPDLGRDAVAEAFAYAWEHWERLAKLDNLPGYLFRVGQTRGLRRKRQPVLHAAPSWPDYQVEPALPAALAALTRRQRIAVVLVHGYGCTLQEVAELTGLRKASVQTHATRGMARLRAAMTTSRTGHGH